MQPRYPHLQGSSLSGHSLTVLTTELLLTKYECSPLFPNGSALAYVEQTRYLGIVQRSARAFKCLLDSAKVKFYCCFNAIYYRAQNAGTELV